MDAAQNEASASSHILPCQYILASLALIGFTSCTSLG